MPADSAALEQFLEDGSTGESRERREQSARRADVPELPPIVHSVLDSVPDSAHGEERLQFLADQVVSLLEKDRKAMRKHIELFANKALTLDASDMDLGGPACNGHVWYRVDGDKEPRPAMGTYETEELDLLFLNLLTEKQMDQLFEDYATDFAYQLPVEGRDERPRRFRATMYFDYDHLGLNMRAIEDELFKLESLGFGSVIERGLMFRHVRDGLTLVTGVTGSGKSSTLDAIVDANNHDVPAHIVIIGQPVEYMHESENCIVRHREVGKDVPSFKDGVVQALRQDPDMIVIGEMRNPDTISAALEVTDSGHKTFSTLHTSSAIETIDRVVAEYPPGEQERVRNRLADVLRCIISQKLCPKPDGGRILAKEILWMTSSAKAAIQNDNTAEIYQMMWEGSSQGMTTLEQDLYRLAREREITPTTAMDFANNKTRMKKLLR
jgi:twitching motility protein PilT